MNYKNNSIYIFTQYIFTSTADLVKYSFLLNSSLNLHLLTVRAPLDASVTNYPINLQHQIVLREGFKKNKIKKVGF